MWMKDRGRAPPGSQFNSTRMVRNGWTRFNGDLSLVKDAIPFSRSDDNPVKITGIHREPKTWVPFARAIRSIMAFFVPDPTDSRPGSAPAQHTMLPFAAGGRHTALPSRALHGV